jgi:hypothetical protein
MKEVKKLAKQMIFNDVITFVIINVEFGIKISKIFKNYNFNICIIEK